MTAQTSASGVHSMSAQGLDQVLGMNGPIRSGPTSGNGVRVVRVGAISSQDGGFGLVSESFNLPVSGDIELLCAWFWDLALPGTQNPTVITNFPKPL